MSIGSLGENGKFHCGLYPDAGARIHGQRIFSDLDGLKNKLYITPLWIEPLNGL